MLRGLALLDSLKKDIKEIAMKRNAEIFNQFFIIRQPLVDEVSQEISKLDTSFKKQMSNVYGWFFMRL